MALDRDPSWTATLPGGGLSGRRLLIAGGGTGGHLFPALAVGEAWTEAGGEVFFVGGQEGLESRLLPKLGQRWAALPVGRLKGGTPLARLRTLLGLPRAVFAALRLVREFRPEVVLGVGGYASAPAVLAAVLLGVPAAIHEQNAFPGLANRWLAPLVRKILISSAASAPFFASRLFRHPDQERILLTGNPVRRELLAKPSPPVERPANTFRLLVFGGSQGARIFAEVVPEALVQLKGQGVAVTVWQQARAPEVAELVRFYQEQGIEAVVAPFFDDMAAAYHQADLVICRAGATTVAELTALGKRALLIPFPQAADDHQTANARALVSRQAGWMLPQAQFTTLRLARFLSALVVKTTAIPQEFGPTREPAAAPGSLTDGQDPARAIVAALLALNRGNGMTKDGNVR